MITVQILCAAYALIAGTFAAAVTTRADPCGLRELMFDKRCARIPSAVLFAALWIGIAAIAMAWPIYAMHRVTTARR